MNIIPTNTLYSSSLLKHNLTTLMQNYSFLNVQTVGLSVLGNPIFVIRLGRGEKKVFYSASIHANEWITSILLMKFIEDYSDAYLSNQKLNGFSIQNLFRDTSIYLMPMINPDGVDLVTGNLSTNSSAFKKVYEISSFFPTIPFPNGWKANMNGVDLKNYQPVC